MGVYRGVLIGIGIDTWTLLDTRNFRCRYQSIKYFGIESPITNYYNTPEGNY